MRAHTLAYPCRYNKTEHLTDAEILSSRQFGYLLLGVPETSNVHERARTFDGRFSLWYTVDAFAGIHWPRFGDGAAPHVLIRPTVAVMSYRLPGAAH